MTESILAVLVNSAVGIFLSGAYLAVAVRIWHNRNKVAAVLPIATGLIYCFPTATYIWDAFHGRASAEANPLGLLLLLLPAIVLLQVLKWSWQNEADAKTILKDLSDA